MNPWTTADISYVIGKGGHPLGARPFRLRIIQIPGSGIP